MRHLCRLSLLLCLFALMGCEGLSHPGASNRLMRLNSYSASNAQTPDAFYDSKYYVDDKTPLERLDEQFDKVADADE